MNTGIFEPTIWTWLFGAGIGTNIGASIILYFVGLATGFATGRRLWKKIRAHHEWQARQHAKQMRAQGLEPDPHPHFDLSDNNDSEEQP